MNRTLNNWPVGEHAVRPAGRPDECFFCNAKVGAQHAAECVIRSRTVVVRVSTEITVSVPEHWTPENVTFHYNEGSWCADNFSLWLEERERRFEEQNPPCLCRSTEIEYVREATPEDEARDGLYVETLPE